MDFKAKCLDEAAEQSRGNCIVREDKNGLFAWLRSGVCWHRDPFGGIAFTAAKDTPDVLDAPKTRREIQRARFSDVSAKCCSSSPFLQ